MKYSYNYKKNILDYKDLNVIIDDLVKKLKVENHVINSYDDLPKTFNIKEEKTCLTSYLEDERHNTLQYFLKYI